MVTRLYPSLQKPVLTPAQAPEEVTESRWHQPLAEPVRRAGLAVALIAASGLFAAPFVEPASETVIGATAVGDGPSFTQTLIYPSVQGAVPVVVEAETVTLDKWWRPLDEPQRIARDPRFTATLAARETAWPFVEFENDNRHIRWHRPLSEPRRAPPRPAGVVAWSTHTPAAAVADASGASAIGDGPSFARTLIYPSVQGAVPFVTAAETVTVDKWHRPLDEPQRVARDPRLTATLAARETAWPFVEFENDNRHIRWHRPLSEPRRDPPRLPGLFAWSTHTPASAEVISADKWWRPFAEPVRFARDPRFTATLAAREQPWPFVEFENDNRHIRWHRPLSEPRRDPPRLPGVVAWSTHTPAAAEVVTLDKWWRAFAEPVRTLPRLLEASQRAFAFVVPHPLPDAQSVARWLIPLAEPQRHPRDPRYRASLVASGEGAWPSVAPANDAANVRWHRPFSEPQRFPRDPRYRATLSASGEAPWPGVQFSTDAAHVRWHRPFAEPVRFLRDPRYGAALVASGEVMWPVLVVVSDLFPVPRQTLAHRAGRVSLVLHTGPRDSTLTNRRGRTSTTGKRLH